MRAKFLNESTPDVNVAEVVTPDLIKDWDQDDYVQDILKHTYAEESYKNPDNLDDDYLDSEDYNNWLIYELEHRCNEVIDMFKYDIIKGGTLTIWRAMMVNDNWLKQLKPGMELGIWWSYEEDAAEPHWGYNNADKRIEVLIKAEVDAEQINWKSTIAANMHPSYKEEKEITLEKGIPLKLLGIKVNKKDININSLKDQMFKS